MNFEAKAIENAAAGITQAGYETGNSVAIVAAKPTITETSVKMRVARGLLEV